MAPPSPTDWTWTAIADHELEAQPTVAPPTPATGTLMRYRDTLGLTWQRNGSAHATAWHTPPETPGLTFQGQLAWACAEHQLSPWSATKTATAT